MNDYITYYLFILLGLFMLFGSAFAPTKKVSQQKSNIETSIIDKDAVEVLIALGYKKKEANDRVIKVFRTGSRTEDTVKQAMNVNLC